MSSPDDPKQIEPKEEADDTQEEEKPAESENEGEKESESQPEGEKPEDEESEGELDEEVTQAKKPETLEPDEKRKRAGGWQRKIERLERQNQLLVEQLGGHRPSQAPPGKPESEKTPEEKAAAYIDGLVDQRMAAREARQREKTVVSDFQRRTAEVRAKYDDFEDVVGFADIPVQSALGQALLTSEYGPSIMYQLAKNPGELARLSALPPLDAAREVGRLEAKLTSSTAPAATSNGSAKRPPAPPTSVNGSAASTRSLEDLPLPEYKRAMRSGRR